MCEPQVGPGCDALASDGPRASEVSEAGPEVREVALNLVGLLVIAFIIDYALCHEISAFIFVHRCGDA